MFKSQQSEQQKPEEEEEEEERSASKVIGKQRGVRENSEENLKVQQKLTFSKETKDNGSDQDDFDNF